MIAEAAPKQADVKVLLAMPSYNAWCSHGARVAAHWCTDKYHVAISTVGSSLIPLGFGMPWCECLDHDFTHFAMLHADIEAQKGWIDVLMGEMERVGADLISTIVPQKNMSGVTSTGVEPYGQWGPRRRLYMNELGDLPETFDGAAIGYPHCPLLVNTGCWLARVRDVVGGPLRPWAAEFPGFQILSKIEINPVTGARAVAIDPEDWNLSRYCFERGLGVYATRKVYVRHEGIHYYDNGGAWGRNTTDDRYWDEVSARAAAGEIEPDTNPRPDAPAMAELITAQGA